MNASLFTSFRGLSKKLCSGFLVLSIAAFYQVPFSQAAILFQDDDFSIDYSEGFIFNVDDTGDQDVTIQLGNDGTDATIIWGDALNELQIGDGTSSIFIDSDTWDISSAGVASGFTGITSTGLIDLSGASGVRLRESSSPNTLAACTTTGEVIVNTTSNRLEVCTTTGVAGVAVWTAPAPAVPSGATDPLTCSPGDLFFNTTSSTLQVCTAADTWNTAGPQDFEDIYAYDADGTLTTSDGDFTINSGTGDVIIDSANWNVTAGGDLDAASITSNGALTADGTTTLNGIVNIGDGGDAVSINSSSWDISTAGAASGFTTIDASGNITTSGGDLFIGAIGLGDAGVDNTTSGASLVGTFDEFDNSASTNVQDVLDDFDALIGSNAANVETLLFYPEYPDAVIYQDGTNNKGLLESLFDNVNAEPYYQWTSNQGTTQDIDVRFRFVLPADFVASGDFTFRYRTGTVTEADNDVEVTFYNVTDAATCASDTTNTSAAVWATGTITAATIDAGCTAGTALDAGDVVEIQLKLMDNNGAPDYANVGYLQFDYTN